MGRHSEKDRLESLHEIELVTAKGNVNRFRILNERGTDTCGAYYIFHFVLVKKGTYI